MSQSIIKETTIIILWLTLVSYVVGSPDIDLVSPDYKTLEPIEWSKSNMIELERRQLPSVPTPPQSAMLVVDSSNGQLISVIPGLLDETLLSKGSFAFGAQMVKFDKLKVLGNVYVNKINGRPLKDSYLLRGYQVNLGRPNGGSIKRQYDDKGETTKPELDNVNQETMTLSIDGL